MTRLLHALLYPVSFLARCLHRGIAVPSPCVCPPLTLQWATAVAVFFLPKHCTLWVVVDMVAAGYD